MNDIIVLYPGGFKPAHAGHLDLIIRYLEHIAVKEVWVLVGPGIRDGISQSVAVEILNKLTEDIPRVIIKAVPYPSPVLASYKIIEEAESGIYALAASSKEEENSKRIKDFVFKHSKEGKFYRPDIQVVELPVNIEPMTYEGRSDENNRKPISASIIRQDFTNNDLENFVTSYPDSTEEQVSFVWNTLKKI